MTDTIEADTRVVVWEVDPSLNRNKDATWFKSLDDTSDNIADYIHEHLADHFEDEDDATIRITRKVVRGEAAADAWDGDTSGLVLAEAEDEDAGPPFISQIQLVAAIWKELDRQGMKSINTRHQNATIEAANAIIEEVNRPTRICKPGDGYAAWMHSDDTGASSKYLLQSLGGHFPHEVHVPHDPQDFGRCVRMLDVVGEKRDKMPTMLDPKHGPIWNAMAARWEELETLYREEYPTGKTPKLYAAIRAIHEAERTCQP